MSDIQTDLATLHNELAKALELIKKKAKLKLPAADVNDLQVNEALSLLDRCKKIVINSNVKPKLRIIHHLACSGGTLISKCLAAMPNIYLLSELHPTTTLHQGGGKPKFLPADITTQARYANVPDIDNLAWTLFNSNIIDTYHHVAKYAGTLIIRDHTHSDFCVGQEFREHSTIANALSGEFELLRIVTLRDPIDSYISLEKNNWVHFSPKTFDEYCKRVWVYLSEYNDEQVFRYEDFVQNPKKIMEAITSSLDVSYDESFVDTFSIFQVTGDSGRSGDIIAPRERRELTVEEQKEFESSQYYKLIADRFNYNSMEMKQSD